MDQLRIVDEPASPDARFVARLRAQVVAALDLPTVPLPERSPIMTDTATAPTTTNLTPYICVSPAVDALAWYADVLGAVETIRYTGDDGRIGHAEITVSGAQIMLSDEYPELGVVAPTTLGGTPTTMHLTVPDVDAAYERFVAAGGRPAGPPRDEAYGARGFSALDPFGHRWMIQTPTGSPSIEEIQAQSEGYTITAPAAPATVRWSSSGTSRSPSPTPPPAAASTASCSAGPTEPGNAGDEYAHVANTKLPLGLTPGRADEAPVLYFRVDDVAAYAARVRELGGEVIAETVVRVGPQRHLPRRPGPRVPAVATRPRLRVVDVIVLPSEYVVRGRRTPALGCP